MVKISGEASFLYKNGVFLNILMPFLYKNTVKIFGNAPFLYKNGVKIIIRSTILNGGVFFPLPARQATF